MFKKTFQKLFTLFQPPNKEAITNIPSEKWKIEILRTKDKQTYFESDISYEYRIINTKTNEIVRVFYRDEYENSEGNFDTGVQNVYFSEDKKSVIAIYEDGSSEFFELPTT